MPVFDLLLKGGTVIDGQRTPPLLWATWRLPGGRIAQIGTVSEFDAKRVFDARDLIVAPGFTDGFTR